MFKVIRFQVIANHPFEGLNDTLIDLVPDTEVMRSKVPSSLNEELETELINGNYNTLLIGKNGSGKSQVLYGIVDIFNCIAASKIKERYIHDLKSDCYLKYFIDGNIYEFSFKNSDKIPICKLNQNTCQIFDLAVPQKVLISCTNLNDKFPIFTKKSRLKNEMYSYLGLRAASNNAFVSINVKRIIESVITIIESKKINAFEPVFDVLNFEFKIEFTFIAGKNLIYEKGSSNLSEIFSNVDSFYNFFKKLVGQINDYRSDTYKQGLEFKEKIENALKYIKSNESSFILQRKKDYKKTYTIDLNEFNDSSELKNLITLKEMEVLSLTGIKLFRKKKPIKLLDISSGEYNFFTILISLISKVENNSLIIIDEPEISLHPNWQQQFMSIVREVFSSFNGLHFVISTHSHYLISDIFKEISNVVILNRDDTSNKVQVRYFEDNTYGWSSDDILYYVFGIRSSRNLVFQGEVEKLLSLISNRSANYPEIKRIIKHLEIFNLNEYDPLGKVLEIGIEYLKGNNYDTN
jgi:predicted ATPase